MSSPSSYKNSCSREVSLNRQKCVFSVPSVKFIRPIVGQEGIRPDPDNVSAIIKMDAPTNIGELRRFLGLLNQQAKYTNDLAEKTKPLRTLLQRNSHWHWDTQQQEALKRIKKEITEVRVPALYDPNKGTVVSADASSY